MDNTVASRSLRSTIKRVEQDLVDILQSGDYYCSEEIARELTAIKNALDHLNLDATLLHSGEWQQSFDPRYTGSTLAGANDALDKTAARLFDYKSQLGAIKMGQLQENDVRELHQWAMTTLQHVQRELAPYAYNSTDRIKQFGDHTGVTDRYTGYRNNLTRSREPFKMETTWMDKDANTGYMTPLGRENTFGPVMGSKNCTVDPRINPLSRANTTLGLSRPRLELRDWGGVQPDNIGSLKKEIRFSDQTPCMLIHRGYRTIDSLYPKSTSKAPPGERFGGRPHYSEHIDTVRYLNDLNGAYQAQQEARDREPKIPDHPSGTRDISVQEAAGINMTFPGKSEYMQRYTMPHRVPTSDDFLINPTPNMQINGRVLGKALYEKGYTEYQSRYEWPDGEKLARLPWMCKT